MFGHDNTIQYNTPLTAAPFVLTSWFFYHDALSLMTAKDTMNWMEDKDYLKYWILPQQDLYRDDLTLNRWRNSGAPPGNSPENMPLDNNLNKDIDDAVNRHVTWTRHLKDDDKRKFSNSTPVRGSSAYLRITHPETGVSPTPVRIIQDVMKVFVSMETVRKEGGIIVNGVGERNGKRSDESRAVNNENAIVRRGGSRKRKDPGLTLHSLVHADAVDPKKELIKLSLQRHRQLEAGELLFEEGST
jgi:hypothetical protein